MKTFFILLLTATAAVAAPTVQKLKPAAVATNQPPQFSAFAPPSSPLFQMGWSPSRTNAPAGSIEQTEILSKRADFDLKARVAIYKGDVRVKDPRMEMACEYLTVKLSQEAGKFDTILAESNVSVDFYDEKGQKVHCTGGRAIYTYEVKRGMTNDLLRLLDDPLLETAQGSWKGDIITLDRGNNTIRATNSRMVIKSEPGSTNRSLLGPMR